jgi:hypothetical protein
VYRPTSIVNNKQESDDDDTDDEFEPLSLVEQTDSQFISVAILDQSMDVDAQEDDVQYNEQHQSSSDNTDDEEENDVQQVDDGHLLPSDGSISSESDLLGDY